MKINDVPYLLIVVALAVGLTVAIGCSGKKSQQKTEKTEMEETVATMAQTELPEAVTAAVESNKPGAEIGTIETSEEEGITLYDIEFKEGKGEIEVAEDGTVLDVVSIVTMEELPGPAAQAIQTAAEGMTISQIEKSEIRAEIVKEGETATLAPLETYEYVYEAELMKDNMPGEITVDAEGNIVEALKWEAD